MPQIKQGWPGNLTAEQEAKLKELWLAMGSLSGAIPEKKDQAQENGSAAPASEVDNTPKKKKRFGIFSRGEKDDENGSKARSLSTSEGSTEDKYGLNKQYKQALQEMSPEELRTTFWWFVKGDSPDALLLRYLRARKWDVQKALVMFVATGHWRLKDVKLDTEITPKGEAWFAERAKNGSGAEKKLGEDFMAQLRLGKSFVHGTDREGRPICFVRVRLHKGGEQTEEALETYTIYTIETTRMMLNEQVDTASLVFDMTDFSLANMDYTPVKFMIKIFEANYPESLGHICVHHSPWVFSSIWNIIKGWLDPVVASKVHFTKDVNELSHFVAPEHIPKELGGKEHYEYKYLEPVAGENEQMEQARKDGRLEKLQKERQSIVDEFEKENIKWCHNEGGEDTVRRREELKQQLKKNYWQMDPYVRARTLYDRQGVIGKDGKIDMYPSSSSSLPNGSASADDGSVD